MKKDNMYVTAGLYGIKDRIAEASRKTFESSEDAADDSRKPAVSVFDSLPEETRSALRARWQDYEYSRKDLLFRLHEFSAGIVRMETDTRNRAEILQTLKTGAETQLGNLDQLPEPDEFSPDFQVRLAENFRALERMRIELIQLQADLPADGSPREGGQKKENLFAELDSVSFGQIFRIGSAFFMPLILMLFFSVVALCASIILTFRFGL